MSCFLHNFAEVASCSAQCAFAWVGLLKWRRILTEIPFIKNTISFYYLQKPLNIVLAHKVDKQLTAQGWIRWTKGKLSCETLDLKNRKNGAGKTVYHWGVNEPLLVYPNAYGVQSAKRREELKGHSCYFPLIGLMKLITGISMQKTQSTATVALAVPKLSQVTQHTQTKAYPQAQLRSAREDKKDTRNNIVIPYKTVIRVN